MSGDLTVCDDPSSWDVLAAESGPKVRHGADERGDQRGVLCRGSPGHGVVQHQPAHERSQPAGLPGNRRL